MARNVDISAFIGIPGLAGTAGYTVIDTAGAELVARTTAGVTESAAVPGFYTATASLPDTACYVVWDYGVGNPLPPQYFEAVGTSSDVDATPTTRKLRFIHKAGSPAVETDLDSEPYLRDKAGTYGIKRADTGTMIVQATGAGYPKSMTKVVGFHSDGVTPILGTYEYDLGSAYNGVPLVYAVEYTYSGVTDHEDGIVSLGGTGGGDIDTSAALIRAKIGTTNADATAVWGSIESNLDPAEIDAVLDDSASEANDRRDLRIIGAGLPVPFTAPSATVARQLRRAATLYGVGYLIKKREDQSQSNSNPNTQTPGDALIAEGDAVMDALVNAGALTEETSDDGLAGLASLSPSGAGLNDTCGTTCVRFNYLSEPVLTP